MKACAVVGRGGDEPAYEVTMDLGCFYGGRSRKENAKIIDEIDEIQQQQQFILASIAVLIYHVPRTILIIRFVISWAIPFRAHSLLMTCFSAKLLVFSIRLFFAVLKATALKNARRFVGRKYLRIGVG